MNMYACGITEAGEEAFCAAHLAVRNDVSKSRVDFLRGTGKMEAQRALTIDCGTRPKGNCLFPVGVILEAEDLGWL